MESKAALAALSALSQATRLAIFRRLIQAGPEGLNVGALGAALEVPGATLTAHLNKLRAAGLIADQREGRVIRCIAQYQRMDELIAYLLENCCAGSSCTPAAACRPAPRQRKRKIP